MSITKVTLNNPRKLNNIQSFLIVTFAIFILISFVCNNNGNTVRDNAMYEASLPDNKYTIIQSDWLSSEKYKCYRYEIGDKVWKLYNAQDELITTINVSDKYRLRAYLTTDLLKR